MKAKLPTRLRRRRWTRREFYRLLDLHFFLNQRVELIGGEIVLMAARKNWHALGIALTDSALRTAFGPNYWVRVQMSLDLKPHSVPDPDLAVIAGSARANASKNNPRSALLIVEVALSGPWYDRGTKGSLYARNAVADYWILNLIDRQLEVYRQPTPDPQAAFGFRYADKILQAADEVSPFAMPSARIKVVDLLP